MRKNGCVTLGVIWFGAAVSVAEIEAGVQSGGNWLALVCGHVVGGVLLFATGLIGARMGRNAMEVAANTFGKAGGHFFAVLNILQLVGWTAVMILQGAVAVNSLAKLAIPVGCVMLALLVSVWLFVVTNDKYHLSTVGIGLLAALAVVLTFRLGILPVASAERSFVGFWSAFEISVAMPLSWLPLIADYTCDARCPVLGTLTAVVIYTAVSIWMYALGILLVRSGVTDLAAGIVKAGVGVSGLIVVMVSTMTTTFLDAYSSGQSVKAMIPKTRPRFIGLLVCGVGAVLAISGIIGRYIEFLSWIASVFAPMAIVILIRYYIVQRAFPRWNFLSWLAGFITYHLVCGSPVGQTLSSLSVAALFSVLPCVIKTSNSPLTEGEAV